MQNVIPYVLAGFLFVHSSFVRADDEPATAQPATAPAADGAANTEPHASRAIVPHEDEFYVVSSFGKLPTSAYESLNSNGHPNTDHTLSDAGYGPWSFGLQHDMWQPSAHGEVGIDFDYINFGHNTNNHPDAVGAFAYYSWVPDGESHGLRVNLELGGCYDYDSRTENGIESDVKHSCEWAKAVVEQELSRKFGLKVRVEFVDFRVPGDISGHMFMAGLTKSFRDDPDQRYRPDAIDRAMRERYGRWSLTFGESLPNYAGGHGAPGAFEIERTQVTSGDRSGFVWSGVVRYEGNQGVTKRQGIAGLAGYEFKDPNLRTMAGFQCGPYLERDTHLDQTKVDGLCKIYVGKEIGDVLVRIVFDRTFDYEEQAHDSDFYGISATLPVK